MTLGERAVQVALAMGDHLRRAKELCGHGQFGRWLKRACPRISRTYANYFMRCAMVTEGEDVSKIRNIQELLLFCGIIQPQQSGETSAPVFCLAIALRRITPAARLTMDDVMKLRPDEQAQLRAGLEPVHQIYQALSAPIQ